MEPSLEAMLVMGGTVLLSGAMGGCAGVFAVAHDPELFENPRMGYAHMKEFVKRVDVRDYFKDEDFLNAKYDNIVARYCVK